MKEDKLVYYYKGKKYEIPMHIQNISLIADFENPMRIEIKSICHNKKECASWKDLLQSLSPGLKEED